MEFRTDGVRLIYSVEVKRIGVAAIMVQDFIRGISLAVYPSLLPVTIGCYPHSNQIPHTIIF